MGPRIARKHVKWYMEAIDTRQLQANGAHCSGGSTHAKEWLREFNTITSPDLQIAYVHQAFERLITKEDIAA